MKCEAIVINRGRAKYYKRASFNETQVTIRKGLKKDNYFIPDGSKFIELEKFIGSKPLWVVDEMTHKALTWTFDKKTGKNKSCLVISSKSDPQSKFKLNVLTKASFWESLAKRLKVGFIATIIYLCAGGGIFLIGLYALKLIFLKESSI